MDVCSSFIFHCFQPGFWFPSQKLLQMIFLFFLQDLMLQFLRFQLFEFHLYFGHSQLFKFLGCFLFISDHQVAVKMVHHLLHLLFLWLDHTLYQLLLFSSIVTYMYFQIQKSMSHIWTTQFMRKKILVNLFEHLTLFLDYGLIIKWKVPSKIMMCLVIHVDDGQ